MLTNTLARIERTADLFMSEFFDDQESKWLLMAQDYKRLKNYSRANLCMKEARRSREEAAKRIAHACDMTDLIRRKEEREEK